MFKLTSQGETALQIVLFLKKENKPIILEDLAQRIKMSEAFIRKIANRLRKNNILSSIRWRSGSISLNSGKYSLYDVLAASGEKLHVTACQSLACSKKKDHCELAILLKPIEAQMLLALRRSIIFIK